MDNKTELTITGNGDNSGITSNNDNNKDIRHENIEEETTASAQPREEPPLDIISVPQNTTQQVSELPSNLNITAASKITSDVVVPTSTIGSNVAAHQKSKSRHQLSSSEPFINLEDNVSMRTYSDTMKGANRARESRRSAPVPYRPATEFDVHNLPRPNSQIILPTSMKRHSSIITPNSDQEFHMLARILVGQSTKDNLVDDGEIIFDTTSFNQASDIQQHSHGQIPSSSVQSQYIPQGSFSVTAAMHQVTNPSRAPEVPPLISTTYGTEIFDQIQSDDDPRLIVWSISRAEDRKQGSVISSVTNASSSKRWSIHEKLERAGKTICGSGLKDKKDNRLALKKRHSNVMPEKVIMAATIEKLIEKLTSGIDYTFLTDFFLTYRTFITPLRLCNLLILRFDWALEGDDEQRRIVRVRTFVTLRHWLLNYFAYDFVPCRALRSTFISYLNTLHSNPLIRNSPRDQRIVQGLKRVIRRLKRIHYRKGVMGILKNGNGGFNIGKKSSKTFKEMEETIPDKFLDVDAITVEHSGVGAGTSFSSSKEKSKKTIKHESSSTLGSILTPGTTDSEDEEIDSLGLNQSSRSRISRPTEFRQSFEATSSNSQHSEDEFSLKRTYENPISSFYNVKLSKSLPTLTNEIVSDWEQDVDDGSGIGSKENKKVPGLEQREEGAITKKKLKSRSSSMGDLSQRRNLQSEFNPLEQSLKENIIVEEEEPPPLPPRRRHRRHTFTYTQPTPAAPPLPSFFKGGFLNFPTRKPKKIVTQEIMNEKFQDRTRKKRSLSLSEAICGFAENDDDDDDDDDEFDLSQIDHAGGIVRRNSSPAYIGSSSLRSEQQREKDETLRRRTGRPSWPQKMSATVGRFAKVLFTPGTGKPGGIKMLCANSEVVTTEEGESVGSVPVENLNNFNGDEPIHVDGFSYVDESLEEEYYDTMRQEDFAGTEEQFNNWDEPSDEDEDEDELQDEEVMSLDDEGLASSTEPYPTSSSIQGREKDDKNNEDLEEQEISQSTRSIRRKAKVWGLGPVIEVEDDDNYYKSSLDTSLVSELKKEEKMVQESSENKKAEEPQSPRRHQRLAKVEEEGELNIVAEPPGNEEIQLEQGLDIEEEEEEHDENNPSSHRLRRLPKVRDLRSVVTLKDLEEKSGKRVSWSTFSSLGTLGIEDTGTTEAILSRALTSSSSSKLKHKESVKSSPKVETETRGKEQSKEFEQEPAKRKDKSIMKPQSSEPVASSSIIPGSPKKSSESSVKRIVITEPPSKKLPDIPVQHTTTTTTAEPSSSSQIPIKNIPSTTQKSSLNKPLPPLPIQDNRSRKPSSISSTLNSQSSYRSFILNYRSEDIAKQFCLIERDLLLKVNWEDLVQVGYTNGKDAENNQNFESEEKKKDIKDIKGKGKEKEVEKEEKVFKGKSRKRENGVDKVIERFNLTCDWVATEIVLTRSLDDRVRLIEKFIRVAQKCLQFSNFATLTQILLGLQSPPIERLRRTWTRIRNEDLRVLKELNEHISHFGNWKVIREAMRKSIDDSTILKELIKQRKRRGSDVRKINTGCIPFLGLYLSDLVFNAAVPSFIDPTPPSHPPTPSSPLSFSSVDTATSPLYHQQPLINFHKHRTTATIVKRVLTFQNLSREYNFSIDKEIYDKCFGLKGLEATKLVVMDLDVDDFV